MMDDVVTVYEKSTCSKCMLVEQILRDRGISFRRVEYYETPLTHEKLRELLRKMGMSARGLLRTGEKAYQELGLGDKELSEDELIDLMISHPDLIQRPIVEKGERAVLARPAENLDALF